jgi:hypothetical protein
MKTAGLVLAMIGCAVLTHGTGNAVPFDPAAQKSSSTRSADTASDRSRAEQATQADGRKQKVDGAFSNERQVKRPSSAKNRSSSQERAPKANRPEQLPNRRERSAPGKALAVRASDEDKPGATAKGGPTGSHALPVRSPSVTRTAAPPLDNARHRGPNSAVVGGPAISTARNTGAINGTRMNRKP